MLHKLKTLPTNVRKLELFAGISWTTLKRTSKQNSIDDTWKKDKNQNSSKSSLWANCSGGSIFERLPL